MKKINRKKINRKMQACKGVVDGASEALDVIAERGIIDAYIVSCGITTPTADGGTDYDSGSVTRGDTDALVKMMSFIICSIEERKEVPTAAIILQIANTVERIKNGAGYNVRQ